VLDLLDHLTNRPAPTRPSPRREAAARPREDSGSSGP
jgi:hypothetical protein